MVRLVPESSGTRLVCESKKIATIGRLYQVKDAAQKLCEMLIANGEDAHVCAVHKFERDKKVIR